MKRIAMGAAFVVLLAAGGCAQKSGAPVAAPKVGPEGGRQRAYSVRTAPVSVQQVQYQIETHGAVEAQDVYRIDAHVAGTVEEVAFNEGNEVTPAQVLCRISPLAYELAAKKAEAAFRRSVADLADMQRRTRIDVELARVRLKQADIELERRKVVREVGAVAEEEVQLYAARRDLSAIELKNTEAAIQTQLDVMQATLREKEADWKIAEESVRKSAVLPPIAGVIEERLVTNGMQVPQGTPIARLVDKRAMRLKFTLAESKAPHVRIGADLTFCVAAYPTRDFKAKVYRIGDLTDPQTRLVTCWARVEPTDAVLKAGFFATLALRSESEKQAVVVPVTATLPTEKGFVAYVVENGKAIQRSLKLGLHVTGDAVEVLSGLKEGEIVVVEGANALQPNVAVTDLGKQGVTASLTTVEEKSRNNKTP